MFHNWTEFEYQPYPFACWVRPQERMLNDVVYHIRVNKGISLCFNVEHTKHCFEIYVCSSTFFSLSPDANKLSAGETWKEERKNGGGYHREILPIRSFALFFFPPVLRPLDINIKVGGIDHECEIAAGAGARSSPWCRYGSVEPRWIIIATMTLNI